MATRLEQGYGNSPTSEVRLEREGNVVHIYKPEGTYTVIYKLHDASVNQNQLPENLDNLVLETVGNYLNEPALYLMGYRELLPYKLLFKTLEERQTPISFADIDLKDSQLICTVGNLLAVGETAIGCAMLVKIAQEIAVERRDFLKILGSSVLTFWLSTPIMSSIARIASSETGVGENISAEFKKLSHKLHPEVDFFTDTLRNVAIAHKERWLAELVGNKPHLATILGPDHAGIEDQIQSSPEDRLAFLRASKPIWEHAVTPETFYKMVRFDFDGKNWQVGEIFEVPELKELIT